MYCTILYHAFSPKSEIFNWFSIQMGHMGYRSTAPRGGMSCYQPQRGKKVLSEKAWAGTHKIQAGDITSIDLMYSVCQNCGYIYICQGCEIGTIHGSHHGRSQCLQTWPYPAKIRPFDLGYRRSDIETWMVMEFMSQTLQTRRPSFKHYDHSVIPRGYICIYSIYYYCYYY
jgi:hypothetical protein